MSHEYYESIDRKARSIAEELDRGDPNRASERLRDELWRSERDPQYAKALVDAIQQYDRRGIGADIAVRYRSGQGSIFEDVGVATPRYYDDWRSRGRTPPYEDFRQERIVRRVASIWLGRDESYYDRYDPYDRRGYDPRYDDRRYDPYRRR